MANFNFNKVILGGRLTADPELKTTPSGISVTSFTIAVNRRTHKAASEAPQADFFNVTAWRERTVFPQGKLDLHRRLSPDQKLGRPAGYETLCDRDRLRRSILCGCQERKPARRTTGRRRIRGTGLRRTAADPELVYARQLCRAVYVQCCTHTGTAADRQFRFRSQRGAEI